MKTTSCCLILMAVCSVAQAQIADTPDENISNIPVNYTEAHVVKYTLPDPLKLANGQSVTDATTWLQKRRAELIKLFEENEYGRIPATAPKVTWQVVSTDSNALNGAAIMKTLAGHMGEPNGPAIYVTLYTPAKADKPVPVLVNLSFNFGGMRGPRRGAAATNVPTRLVLPAPIEPSTTI